MTNTLCEVCSGSYRKGIRPWHFVCDCGHEVADLIPYIDSQIEGGELNELDREVALRTLRQQNFDLIIQDLEALRAGKSARKLLDVGCAHGWFIERAQRLFEVTGIEPDRAVALQTMSRKLPVRIGFFPEVLEKDETYDVIIFNDVLEHIPDLNTALSACAEHLSKDGVLAVNAPNSKGVIYRLARVAARVGFPSAFDRMWQVGFPSPHLRYFSDISMRDAAEGYGFTFVEKRRLPSMAYAGLWSRIRYSRDAGIAKSLATATVAAVLIPMISFLPEDISVWYFKKKPTQRDTGS